MTQASEVTVTAEEIGFLLVRIGIKNWTREQFEAADKALAAFLAARVPDAVTDQGDDSYQSFGVWEAGHNALRAAVLRGLDQ